jgi:glutathione peroxidase
MSLLLTGFQMMNFGSPIRLSESSDGTGSSVFNQENSSGQEIINALKYVRPGNGFQPKCIMFDKIIINGEGEHPVFSWLKTELPVPSDDSESLMGDPKFIIWKPVKRSDIAWNFEKFLIDKNGKAIKRYSKSFQTAHISKDISSLI